MTDHIRAAASGLAAAALLAAGQAGATLVSITNCNDSAAAVTGCNITTTPPNPVEQDPNDGQLLAWDEVQNFELTENLYVDRVADETASFVGQDSNGFFITAGTIVASHYLQWDPVTSSGTVEATVNLDSTIFAIITADQKLFDSDAFLGLPGLDYNDFTNRGLESQDSIVFNGNSADVRWTASSPGDWTRLITAFSPGGEEPPPPPPSGVPAPPVLWLMLAGLAGLAIRRRQP